MLSRAQIEHILFLHSRCCSAERYFGQLGHNPLDVKKSQSAFEHYLDSLCSDNNFIRWPDDVKDV